MAATKCAEGHQNDGNDTCARCGADLNPSQPTLGRPPVRARLQALEDAMNRQAAAMDDPKGDGSGDDARSPHGSDYNDLFDLVSQTLNAILHDA